MLQPFTPCRQCSIIGGLGRECASKSSDWCRPFSISRRRLWGSRTCDQAGRLKTSRTLRLLRSRFGRGMAAIPSLKTSPFAHCAQPARLASNCFVNLKNSLCRRGFAIYWQRPASRVCPACIHIETSRLRFLRLGSLLTVFMAGRQASKSACSPALQRFSQCALVASTGPFPAFVF